MFESSRLVMSTPEVPGWRGAALEKMRPGAALAAVLARTDPATLSDFDLISYLSACERQTAWAQARQLAAIDELARRRTRETPLHSWAAHEIAAELRITRQGAQQRLELAHALRRLPDTAAMFARGELDLVKTRSIASGVAVLDRAGAHAVEARVLGRAADQTGPQLTAAVRRAVLRVDSAAAAKRHEAVRVDRAVAFHVLPDGAAGLWAVGPAPEVQALYLAITARADQAKSPGDDRSLDQRRFDVLTDAGFLHLGDDTLPRHHGRRTQLQVTVAATTLLGLDDQPGELAGYGPVTADVARELAPDATWRRILTDPASGVQVDYGTTVYRPPQSLVDRVLAKHPTCRGLGCRQPAARTELDHTVEFPAGPTAEHNLGPRCKRCHRLKHEGDWETHQLLDGTFLYIAPSGHTYRRPPDPVLHPPDDPPTANDTPAANVGAGANVGGATKTDVTADVGDIPPF
ncbi:MAG: DUF222 domain-containing protein [Actinomycetes bacterium]